MHNGLETERYQKAEELFKQRRFADAFPIYAALAKHGDVRSQVLLGWMYSEGYGISSDKEKAKALFLSAAKLGSKEGAFYCGRLALSESRHDEAIKWFTQAAEQGYGPALLWLGLIYARGMGIEVDIRKGVRYLKQSARAGNYYALRELGMIMTRGNLGFWNIPFGCALLAYATIRGVIGAVTNRDPESLIG